MNGRPLTYHAGMRWARMPTLAKAVVALGVVCSIAGLGAVLMKLGAQASEPTPQLAARIADAPQRTPAQIKADREINIVLAGARWLKESMKKPETFELLKATMIDGEVICYEYRARNSFNDRRTERYVISDNVSSSKAKDWNKLCAGKSGEDYTSVRAVL